MELNKKTLFRIAFGVILLVAFVFALLTFIGTLGVKSAADFAGLGLNASGINSDLWLYLAISLGLLGMLVSVALKILGKSGLAVGIPAVLGGVLALVFVIISLPAGKELYDSTKSDLEYAVAMGLPEDSAKYKAGMYQLNSGTFLRVISLAVFALYPIAYGLRKWLCKSDASANG